MAVHPEKCIHANSRCCTRRWFPVDPLTTAAIGATLYNECAKWHKMKKTKAHRRGHSSGAKPASARRSSRARDEGESGVAGFRSPASVFDYGEALVVEAIPADRRPQAATVRATPPALRSLE